VVCAWTLLSAAAFALPLTGDDLGHGGDALALQAVSQSIGVGLRCRVQEQGTGVAEAGRQAGRQARIRSMHSAGREGFKLVGAAHLGLAATSSNGVGQRSSRSVCIACKPWKLRCGQLYQRCAAMKGTRVCKGAQPPCLYVNGIPEDWARARLSARARDTALGSCIGQPALGGRASASAA